MVGTFLNPWYSYQIGSTWHQAWYDDVESLGHKYELTLDRDLAGIGIWALSYDNGYDELWQLIEDTFTAPVSVHAPGANEAFSLSPVYPNPVVPGTAAIHVAYHLPLPRAAITMRVVDILGRLVYDRRYVGNSPSGNISVPTHNLVPGMYRLIAETEGSVFLRTFIVSR